METRPNPAIAHGHAGEGDSRAREAGRAASRIHLMALTMSGAVPEPTPLPRRKALQQRVSAAILNAAARTLATQGDRANLADVAEEAGVARATVYRYYPNRGALVDELVRRTTENIHERLVAARVDKVSVDEGITRAVRAFVDEGDAFVVLLGERRRSEGSEFDRLLLPPIQQLLQTGRSQGHIRPDIQPVVLAEALLGVAAGVLRNSSLGRDDLVATISTMFLDGARASSEPEAPRVEHAR